VGKGLRRVAGRLVAVPLAAAFLAPLVLKHGQPPTVAEASAAPVLDPQVGAGLLHAHFSDIGYRTRPSYPHEFAAVFGPAPGRPYRGLAAAEWSERPAAPAPDFAAEKPPAKAPVARCGEACRRKVLTAGVLPPPRPASLVAEAPEPAPAIVAAAPRDERVRLLGMRLPGFVPSGEKVVNKMVSWGGAVTGLIGGM
jgi:hypothetical protein